MEVVVEEKRVRGIEEYLTGTRWSGDLMQDVMTSGVRDTRRAREKAIIRRTHVPGRPRCPRALAASADSSTAAAEGVATDRPAEEPWDDDLAEMARMRLLKTRSRFAHSGEQLRDNGAATSGASAQVRYLAGAAHSSVWLAGARVGRFAPIRLEVCRRLVSAADSVSARELTTANLRAGAD
ncbi:hypothetical protein K466DRAFT_387480 [Polyporus arcularius HHB13444]|uniref:Uncharacterized protein n=1 Tax=Polyporus arcularius HHB13444 TaxID=1314778 RepID=A0A5C3NTG0_9APHY|nr:hypothetical protein K466DRAFT_387480 [Polyporus arcularius HHB13444]